MCDVDRLPLCNTSPKNERRSAKNGPAAAGSFMGIETFFIIFIYVYAWRVVVAGVPIH